jgi:hypothetical protein
MEKTKIGIVDQQALKGILHYKVYKHVNGEKQLVEEVKDSNLIVNLAREQMARLITGDVTGRAITKIGFGVDGTDPNVNDKLLTNPFMKNVNGYEYPEMGQAQINWSLTMSEGNGKAIKEFGMFVQNGALFARRVRSSPINKESDISLEGTWTIIF